ncbi:MAG TPA: transcriptional regulator [Anaerolineales bacterium]|jgi:DNA-binding transcriptional ArsR family regulator|nr:transcriptional regulator [Anaerolineales bacterium]HUV28703.1 transcriptional regulator [Anaerolineales bacterium]
MGLNPRKFIDVDRLIHEPARLLIVTILSAVESADFLYLQRETGLTKGNLSSHLSKLEAADYVEINKTYRGKIPLTVCRLSESGQKAFSQYRDQLKYIVDNT